MDRSGRSDDIGTGYGLAPATYKTNLVEVGPGTPMGELMRRYWQPCFKSEDLTSDKPERVRLLGEDLILFRDKQGRVGLTYEHCCHRGTSLYYGRIEEDGIRCCHHGWKFDPQGRCLEQPAEVGGGRARDKIRQPWYPVEERYGLVYAYMGPPNKKPVLPRWKQFEDLAPDEIVEVMSIPPYGPRTSGKKVQSLDFNWLRAFETTMDSPHVPWLHYHHSGDQFTGLKMADTELPPYAQIKDMVANIVAERTERGVRQGVSRPGPGGQTLFSCNEAMVPNVAFVPNFIDLMYCVPVDDTHYIPFLLWRSKHQGQHSGINERHGAKTWWEMTEEEHRRFPGDYEAQSSIGALPPHSREHLSQGDIALVMLRRRLEEAVRDVAEGRDPVGVSFDPDIPPIESRAHSLRPLGTAA